jgi:hypothetical protein
VGPLRQADAAFGLQAASPAGSEFAGPDAVALFEEFGFHDAIRSEVSERLA